MAVKVCSPENMQQTEAVPGQTMVLRGKRHKDRDYIQERQDFRKPVASPGQRHTDPTAGAARRYPDSFSLAFVRI
jgi:hypothetical protein